MKTKDYNIINIQNLAFILFMPILVDFVHIMVRQRGISGASGITMMIYIFSMLIMLFRAVIPIRSKEFMKDIFTLFAVWAIFLFSDRMFPQNASYMRDTEAMLVYSFYIPLSVFSVRKINDYTHFWDIIYKMGKITLALALVILLGTDYKKYIVYMGFSYALMPFICVFYHQFRAKRNKTALLLFLIGAGVMLSFGSRAAFLFTLLYVGVYELIASDAKLSSKILICVLLGGILLVVTMYFENILQYLSELKIFSDSYFIQNALRGQLFESKTRTALYTVCRERINTMGWEVGGFFSDRYYCALTGNKYPHNIAYELLMSWGWIIGTAALALLAILLMRSVLVRDRTKRDVAVFVIVSLFLRYIISGSYIIEGRFWIMLFLLAALAKRDSHKSAVQ